MDSSTQVYLYLGGHGGYKDKRARILRPAADQVCGKTVSFEALSATELETLASGRNDPPFLEVSALGLCGAAVTADFEVYLNQTYLGDLPQGSSESSVRFELDPGLLQSSGNEVWIRNGAPSAAFLIAEIGLSVGALLPYLLQDTLSPEGGLTPGGHQQD